MELKDAIKKYRKEAHLTQTELGKRLGVGLSTIARYESGEIKPTTKRLKQLSLELEHDFFADVVNSMEESISEDVKSNKHTLKKIDLDKLLRESLLFPHTNYFRDSFEYLGIEAEYETSDYNRYWTFKTGDAVSEPINEKEIESLFDRFFAHMKIDFEAFIKEHDNNVRETEEEKK